ncbi:MAG TPA: TauD/TfdA family dioxygenase [Pseudomonadales bacterium]
MAIEVVANPGGFGARITGVDLTQPLAAADVRRIRAAWLAHQVVYFPDQPMTHDDLERFTAYLGEFGQDPYVAPVEGHPHVLEVRREPDETPSPFGAAWHSDWSFQATPPAATLLHAKVVPPVGGDTWYADGRAAYEALDPAERAELESLTALHSARRAYSPEGYRASRGDERSMKILPSEKAYEVQEHPVIRTHPETGRKALWVNPVYTIGIKGMADPDAAALLKRLCTFATSERFVYKHRWAPDMLTLWDNRSVQHCARGGYDGHRRVMHRTTVAGDRPF